ncbi:hypothetical protein ATSB10_02600 [Dyella thiooxydans]|uniref:Uncharacterized protein n=1 Tax=Dyella thiooxydans TaxID=445710 RepID=A0A160MXK9_9GAMM|nr:hypothetical protein ATSB10_02600 [Dyella thiooxydans]
MVMQRALSDAPIPADVGAQRDKRVILGGMGATTKGGYTPT